MFQQEIKVHGERMIPNKALLEAWNDAFNIDLGQAIFDTGIAGFGGN